MIFLLHIAPSISLPALSPVLFMCHWHASSIFPGRPLFISPRISVLYTLPSIHVYFVSPPRMPDIARASQLSVIFFCKPAPLSLFLGCVRSWSCLCVPLRTSIVASSSRSPGVYIRPCVLYSTCLLSRSRKNQEAFWKN